MLGRVGLLDPELFNQLPGGLLAIAQQFDNRDPRRICESLKDLALELPECIGHLDPVYSNNRMFIKLHGKRRLSTAHARTRLRSVGWSGMESRPGPKTPLDSQACLRQDK